MNVGGAPDADEKPQTPLDNATMRDYSNNIVQHRTTETTAMNDAITDKQAPLSLFELRSHDQRNIPAFVRAIRRQGGDIVDLIKDGTDFVVLYLHTEFICHAENTD